MLISFNMAAETPLSKNYQSTGLADYVSNVLKSQFGSSEDFLAFERHFYYQIEELNSHRVSTKYTSTRVVRKHFQEILLLDA